MNNNPGIGRRPRALALVEILIVAAILAIVAAIGVSRWRDAHVRSQYAEVLDDFRHIRRGIGAYVVDWGVYPRHSWGCAPFLDAYSGNLTWGTFLTSMTTPVAYLDELKVDPFRASSGAPASENIYSYMNLQFLRQVYQMGAWCPVPGDPSHTYTPGGPAGADSFQYVFRNYCVLSAGPDGDWGGDSNTRYFMTYDPTNGAISAGNIFMSDLALRHPYFPPNSIP